MKLHKRFMTIFGAAAMAAVMLVTGCAPKPAAPASAPGTTPPQQTQAPTPSPEKTNSESDSSAAATESDPAVVTPVTYENYTGSPVTIKVGATAVPHGEILEAAKPILAKQGITLDIVNFTDYVQPNVALNNGDIDADYFQHLPFLEDFNKKNKTDLVSIGAIHYEPFGIFPGKTKKIADLKDGAKIAVPNDTTNEARALLLLEAQGLIKLKDGADLNATKNDIVENPKKLEILELEAAQIPRSLSDVDLAVINGNFALDANLHASTDALALEANDSKAADTMANIIAVKRKDAGKPELLALVNVLKGDEIKKFITDKYQGAVIPK
jgi:D-methionine transport system substrate-binding protein